jgi:large subunit ribosomal protein L1
MADDDILKAVSTALQGSKERERKFRQTVDLAINLQNVDLSVPKNRIEEEIPLPHGRGHEVKVGIFASPELAAKAKGVADVVITPDEISEFAGDKKKLKKVVNDIGFFLAEAPLMPTIGKSLGVVLGPRGKMPRPFPPGADPAGLIESLKRTVKVRSRDKPTFHTVVGVEDMDAQMIAENIGQVLKRVESRLEHGRMNIRSAYVKTSMGPSVKVI